MPPSDDKSRIDDLNKALYSRTAPNIRTRRKLRFADAEDDLKPAWDEPTDEAPEAHLNESYKDHSMSFFTKLLIGSVIFCVIAVGAGAYLFLNGANLISGNNISIAINGPVSIAGGEPVSFAVNVTNNNNASLQMVDMSVTFPAGATDPANPGSTLTSSQQFLGDIPAGGATSTRMSAIIFGEENSQKQIDVTLTYQIKGSSAIFTKQQSYDVLISSSPITITASSFSNITSGQAFDMTVMLKSNSKDILKNVIMKASYPFGYSFVSSNVPPLSDNATWNIGDIPPGASRSIVIHGTLSGEDTDIRAFHFSVGAKSQSNASTIGTEYGIVEQDVSIEKPFVSLALGVDNDQGTGSHVGSFNSPERVTVSWFNNLSTAVSNMTITASLSGTAYDKTKLQPGLGYFDSANDKIVWSQQTNPELASVAAGANGTVSFTITPTDESTAANPIVDPTIIVAASVNADRTQESNVSGSLASTVSRTIKVASKASLSGRLIRTSGPFVNTGPIPPKAESKTTYTVVWTIGNTSNTLDNAQVTATLPPYVSWVGSTAPSSENITYDQNSGTVTWNAGTVNPYSNDPSNRREVDFQISFDPSVSQVGTSPTLVNQTTLTATDDFTGSTVQSSQDYLTSSFSTDPSYQEGDETVTQ